MGSGGEGKGVSMTIGMEVTGRRSRILWVLKAELED